MYKSLPKLLEHNKILEKKLEHIKSIVDNLKEINRIFEEVLGEEETDVKENY